VRVALGDSTDDFSLLVRLLLLGDRLDADAVGRVLPVADCPDLLVVEGAEVRCPVEVAPHGDDECDWWVVSDRTDVHGRPQRTDHVLGVGGASTTLAQLTIRRPVQSALDIGTGCGVQTLHLSRHATQLTATDVVPRALRLAATTFALSGIQADLVDSDLVDAVADRTFDLVVSNPPFVVAPAPRFAYRDGGRDGDDMSRLAVRAAASVLAEGGVAQLLVNWLHLRGEDWHDRVASWVTDLGCDAWLVQRDVQEPADYVGTWSRDAGDYDESAAVQWLSWFRQRRVDAIGFGWVLLRRAQGPHRIAVEEMAQPVDQPLGGDYASWLDRVGWLRHRSDQALLGTALLAAPQVRHDVTGDRGDGGWLPLAQALRLDGGLRWSLPCDDPTAALVAGCDGTTALRTLVAVLAPAIGRPEAEAAEAVCGTVRGLIDRGILLPP